MLPSAAFNVTTKLAIGAGVLVNPTILLNEISSFHAHSRTFVDPHCGIIKEEHILQDSRESFLKRQIGIQEREQSSANSDRALRKLSLAMDCSEIKDYLNEVSSMIHSDLDKKKSVLLEGTQGTYLSLYHGG